MAQFATCSTVEKNFGFCYPNHNSQTVLFSLKPSMQLWCKKTSSYFRILTKPNDEATFLLNIKFVANTIPISYSTALLASRASLLFMFSNRARLSIVNVHFSNIFMILVFYGETYNVKENNTQTIRSKQTQLQLKSKSSSAFIQNLALILKLRLHFITVVHRMSKTVMYFRE